MRLAATLYGQPTSWLGSFGSTLELRLAIEQFSKKVVYSTADGSGSVNLQDFEEADKTTRGIYFDFLKSVPISAKSLGEHLDFSLGPSEGKSSTMNSVLSDDYYFTKFANFPHTLSANPGESTQKFLEASILPLARIANRIEILDPFAASALARGDGAFLKHLLDSSTAPICIKSVYPSPSKNQFWTRAQAFSMLNESVLNLLMRTENKNSSVETILTDSSPMIHDRAVRFGFTQSSVSLGLTNSLGAFAGDTIKSEIKIFNQANKDFHVARKHWDNYSSNVASSLNGRTRS